MSLDTIPKYEKMPILAISIVVIAIASLFYFGGTFEQENKERIKIAKQSFIQGDELICRNIQSYKIISKSKGWKLAQQYTIYTNGDEVFNLNECKKYEE
jgi:hypothetical protein